MGWTEEDPVGRQPPGIGGRAVGGECGVVRQEGMSWCTRLVLGVRVVRAELDSLGIFRLRPPQVQVLALA